MKLWLKNPAYTPDLAHKLKIAAEPVSQKPLWAHVFFQPCLAQTYLIIVLFCF